MWSATISTFGKKLEAQAVNAGIVIAAQGRTICNRYTVGFDIAWKEATVSSQTIPMAYKMKTPSGGGGGAGGGGAESGVTNVNVTKEASEHTSRDASQIEVPPKPRLTLKS